MYYIIVKRRVVTYGKPTTGGGKMNSAKISHSLRAGASISVLTLAAPLLTASAFAGSLPTNGKYVSGSGAIQSGANGMTIDQSSARGVIDWQSFSIAKGKTVQFDNGKGATLNEVTGQNLSQIAGSLKATGSVYLVNPSGVLVTSTGKVTALGSFGATSSGNVVNDGSISAGGQVSLISDGHGNVINGGNIAAAQVRLNAAGGNVYALAGNNGGVIRATGTANIAGHVWLTASGTTTISGSVSAKNANGSGGMIIATGKTVSVGSTADLNASGTKGGTILIGGDIHGGAIGKDNLVAEQVATANATNVARGARIDANGTQAKGGSVVVWSNDHTNFAGSISARGNTAGGFTEVSSHGVLGFNGQVDLTSAFGKTGTLLLDPENVTISTGTTTNENCTGGVCTPTGDNSILNVTTLEDLLATANLDVTTGGTGSLGSQAGNITVAAPVTWSSANTLTLDAYHSITIDKTIAVTGTGGLDLITDDGGSGGTLSFGSNGNVTFADLASALTIDGAAYTLVGNIATLASDIAANPSGDYALANNYNAAADGTYARAPIQTNFAGTFDGLGNTIKNLTIDDTTSADSVGLFAELVTGGEIANVVLTNANIQAGEDPYAGTLLGLNFGGLVFGDSAGGTLTQTSGALSGLFGGLVGYNVQGTISNSSASTAVSCADFCYVGGLLGSNVEDGIIGSSYATGAVLGGVDSAVGGLVGKVGGGGASFSDSYATGTVTGGTGADVGGLAGWTESGSIKNSYATGVVSGGAGSVDGGLLGIGDMTVTASYATGNVSGVGESTVGGLEGAAFGKKIENSSASGAITDGGGYYADAGGLIGYADHVKLSGDFATGSVTGADYGAVGGLIGDMLKVSLDNSYATGAVVAGIEAYAGGLVGIDESGSIANSNASGTVTADTDSYVGGLVGTNLHASATISDSFATGTVTGTEGTLVGGLAGYFEGKISGSYATGAVTGGIGSEVGGLVSNNDGTITGSYASGLATCSESCNVGGLVSQNYGTIESSYATGAADGGNYSTAGGLAGENEGTISDSYATGAASVGTGIGGVGGGEAGGLVGVQIFGTISTSFATGAVSGGNTTSVGGLVGFNLYDTSTITNSYATGNVSAGTNSWVGGLVGFDDGGFVSDSYSTGAPTGGSGSDIGGLIGAEYGTTTDSYWDTTTSGITNLSQGAGNIPNDPGITGLTTTQLQAGLPAGFDPSIWGESPSINGGLPYLLANPPPAVPARMPNGLAPAVWTGESVAKRKSQESRGNPEEYTVRSVYE